MPLDPNYQGVGHTRFVRWWSWMDHLPQQSAALTSECGSWPRWFLCLLWEKSQQPCVDGQRVVSERWPGVDCEPILHRLVLSRWRYRRHLRGNVPDIWKHRGSGVLSAARMTGSSHSKLIHFNRPFWHIIAAILMAKRGICCSLVPTFIHWGVICSYVGISWATCTAFDVLYHSWLTALGYPLLESGMEIASLTMVQVLGRLNSPR